MEYGISRSRRPHRAAGIPFLFVIVVIAIAGAYAAASAAGGDPTRALWISPSVMSSAPAIRRAVSSAVSGGFDTVIAPVALGARAESDAFDGPTELLRHARENGLRVHLSVAVNVAAGVGELPAAREHVIYQHPDWLMVPRQLAPEMLKIDGRSPAYLGQIARWTRLNADRVEGLYLSPLDPDAASYLVGAVVAAIQRYAADGVYLEALDFPGRDFDYSRHAMELFRSRMRAELSPAERARMEEVEAIDPFGYPEEFPDEWRAFREAALTRLLERLRAALSTANPSTAITAGAAADPDASVRDHFQNWRTWLDRGIVERIGYRHRSTSTVLFSIDGAIPPDSPGPARIQAAAIGVSR